MHTTESRKIRQAALSLHHLGFSAIPVNPDKTPAAPWKKYQSSPMADDDVPKLFLNGYQLAIVAGAVSGNLECLDLDDPTLFDPFLEALENHSPGLPAKLCQRKTPNGYHIIYRCEERVAGNQKFAMSADNQVRIETRGEGGYFLHSPSKGYKVIKNSLIDCPVLSADEVRAVHTIARMFDERDRPEEQPGKTNPGDDVRPGSAFNAEHYAGDILENYGWKPASRTTGGMGFTRPGKKEGVSGVVLNTGNLYVWSTNAHPLEAEQSYSPFTIYTMYTHDGDFSAAARDLAAKGYASPQAARSDSSANIANGFAKSEPWENPISIETPLLPSVTGKMMPGTIGDMVFAISANRETPPELAAIISLAVVATACQKKYAVASSPGHIEQLSLWGVAALESGNRKSSVEKKIVAPLRKWEADTRESLEPVIKEATAQRENDMVIIKGLRGQLSKCKPSDRDRIKTEILILENDLTEIPKPPQVWDQDITPEHLGTVMDTNNECLGLFSSEGGIFDIIGGRYSKGVPNLDLFLQSHSGDPVRVSRGSRPPVNLSEPALSMGISPQPSVIKAMSNSPGFRGRGLVARFMYVLPTSPLGNRCLKKLPPVPDEVYERYSAAIQRLLNEDYPEDGPTVIHMSTEARDMWTDFALAVEVDLRDGGRFEHIKDWAGKLPGLVARIAGVYHCIEPDGMTISYTTMRMALEFSNILIPHALATFDLMGADEGMSGARKILCWIKKNNLSDFSGRDCFEATKGTFKKVSIMKVSLDVLKEHFIIRDQFPVKKPGRPKNLFEVNPQLKLNGKRYGM